MSNHIILTLLILVSNLCISQTTENTSWYWVQFNSKDITTHNICQDFSQEAKTRREKAGVDFDFSDYPVSDQYISSIDEIADSISVSSRWFNMVATKLNIEQLDQVQQLPFVSNTYKMNTSKEVITETPYKSSGLKKSEKEILLKRQVQRMDGNLLDEKGLNGSGIRIAIFDAGFESVNRHPAFKHIRDSNRIISTFDFVKNSPYVYGYHKHGTAVLSNIAGVWDSVPMGLATQAEFLLARTINNSQVEKSEMYWLAAIEWADRQGVQIVNSSLGFGGQKYFQEELDGQTAFITKAANMAARKGILIINSAGNEGNGYWHTLVAPADADSVLTVGGVNPDNEFHINFSSYGPTADNRRKPNVSNYGKTVVADSKGGIDIMYGTSFSCPLTVGFAACIWQDHPEENAMDIFKRIEQASHLYPYYDYSLGYGIPNGGKYFSSDSSNFEVTISQTKDLVTVSTPRNYFTDFNRISYLVLVHVENANGHLNKYWGIEIREGEAIELNSSDIGSDAKIIRVYLNGTTTEYELE